MWLGGVECDGDEEEVSGCVHGGWGITGGCNHGNDAGVVCSGELVELDVVL